MKKTLAAFAAISFSIVLGTSAQAQTNLNPIGVDQEHYQCYQIKGATKALPVKTLRDQFGGRKDIRVIGPVSICAPVSKNGELVADKETHLVCYQIADPKPLKEPVPVLVLNQFGKFRFDVVQAETLCLPSLKRRLDVR
jgi:hypothetical protein